jgi:CheY-like chemotaxis protein
MRQDREGKGERWPQAAGPLHPGMPMLVWIVDDASSNHRAVMATVQRMPEFTCEGFLDGDEAVAEFTHRTRHAADRLPRVILMDFYLGGTRGDDLTERLRAVHTPLTPIIVGYSSVASASRQIVAAGGDLVLRKHTAFDGTNPDLRLYLETLLRIA